MEKCHYCTGTLLGSSPFRWNKKVCCSFCFQTLNDILEKLKGIKTLRSLNIQEAEPRTYLDW